MAESYDRATKAQQDRVKVKDEAKSEEVSEQTGEPENEKGKEKVLEIKENGKNGDVQSGGGDEA